VYYKEYEILNYSPKFFVEVVDIQKYLWPAYTDNTAGYLKWKFEDNPFNKKFLGIVALYRGEVVGFIGLFVTRWRIGNKKDCILMLSPSDICVHPDHRKKGLFSAMTAFTVGEFENTAYKAFIGLSINTSSGIVYQKMGWPKIADRTSARQYSITGLINWALTKKTGKSLLKNKINYGIFGNIEVSNKPRPEDMYSVIVKQKTPDDKIVLCKDIDFLKWRFLNIRRKYFFYYHWKNGSIDGYVVIETVDNSTSGHVLDYAETENGIIHELLQYIIRKRHFDILSAWNFNLREEFYQTLESLGFSATNLLVRMEKKFPSEFPMLPVFVKPAKKTCKEEDWFIEGIDIRDIKNWEINRICSDIT